MTFSNDRCWKCGYSSPEEKFYFCPECGANQQTPACPKCHEDVKRDQKFCMKCGTKLENEE